MPFIVLTGPTASGKSSLAVRLARTFKGVVISADSRQVYRGLDIGSGKITRAEMRGVPHFLLDVASPRRTYTVAQYQRDVERVLRSLPDEQPVFLVGGSPFYVEAVLSPTPFPQVKPNAGLRRLLERRTTAELVRELRRRDPRRATSIDLRNRRRIIRALEILRATGKRIQQRNTTRRPALILGIDVPRARLYRAIDRRVDQRMRHGMLAEVHHLHAAGLSWDRLERFGLEYRELAKHLRSDVTRDQAVLNLKHAIHAFARRQLTWFRSMPELRWISTPAEAERLVRTYLTRRR